MYVNLIEFNAIDILFKKSRDYIYYYLQVATTYLITKCHYITPHATIYFGQ